MELKLEEIDPDHDGDWWVHALDGAWHLCDLEHRKGRAIALLRCTGRSENESAPDNDARAFAATMRGALPAQSPLCERCQGMAVQRRAW